MKSMTLYLNDKKLLNANRDRSNEFPSEFQENLKQLIAVILLHLNRSKGQQADVAYATALFLKDGFGVLDRGLVLSLVCFYSETCMHYSRIRSLFLPTGESIHQPDGSSKL